MTPPACWAWRGENDPPPSWVTHHTGSMQFSLRYMFASHTDQMFTIFVPSAIPIMSFREPHQLWIREEKGKGIGTNDKHPVCARCCARYDLWMTSLAWHPSPLWPGPCLPLPLHVLLLPNELCTATRVTCRCWTHDYVFAHTAPCLRRRKIFHLRQHFPRRYQNGILHFTTIN